jgi:hypothetical protein
MHRRDEPSPSRRHATERGVALIAVLLAVTLLLALAGGVMQVTVTEARIAAHHRDAVHVLYAAEAMVERIRADVRGTTDVDLLLTGPVVSSLVDGASGGVRTIHGTTMDLTALTNVELCGRQTTCPEAAISAVTAARPWGGNNPRWRLFAHAWIHDVLGPSGPAIYAVAWIGDDPDEIDGNPLRDTPGQGRIAVRVRVYGPHGAQREVDVILAGVSDRPQVVGWVER